MSNGLTQKLENSRTSILLAEIGAYLHDLGKARNEFIELFSKNGLSTWEKDKHNFPSIFPKSLQDVLFKVEINICGEKVNLMDFIEKHHSKKEDGTTRKDCEIPPILRTLYANWNGHDGIDSGLDKGATESQRKNNVFIATAFGYEPDKKKIETQDNLTEELYKHVEKSLNDYINDKDIRKLRKTILKDSKNYYLKFLGETRRSANDVTLWDHSYSVATLVKCGLAKNVIDCSKASFDTLDHNWKILSINMDILSILSKGIKIGDILGYKDKIDEALDNVKVFIEEEYPIGNEIYRDLTGIYFLIPDINLEELIEKISDKLKEFEPELMLTIIVKNMPVTGLSIYKFDCNNLQENIPKHLNAQRRQEEDKKKEILKKLLPEGRRNALREISYPTSLERFFVDKFSEDWNNKEVCPICRLRPMKEKSDGCIHCLQRRKPSAERWIKNSKQTIWLDEVADHNDRIVLLVGCFVVDRWLDGSFIKTTAITIDPPVPKNVIKLPIKKNPSPARIRRCWETTQEFISGTVFTDILTNFPYAEGTSALGLRKKRILFKIEPSPDFDVQEGATIDMGLKDVKFNPVCIDESNNIFISTVNLQILKKWGNRPEDIVSYIQNIKNIKIKTEKDINWKNGKISECNIAEEKFQDYLPYIKIYDSPDQFMAIVPAYDALNIATKITQEYEVQFSKVRDRLPFHIGIIAFHRKTPLHIAIDAGKRLIEAFKRDCNTINAKVDSPPRDITDIRFGPKVKELKLQVDLCYSSTPLKWRVSYSTGDPDQEDEWHPYFRFNGGNPNIKDYSFEYDSNGHYVVHVKKLQSADCVSIEPSYFKLSFLENSADRFNIDESFRPLDDIHRLNELWNKIESKLRSNEWSISQIHAFWQETKKRYEDYGGDIVWENFVKSSIKNTLKISSQSDEGKELFQATKDGLLDLCLCWNLQVRKVKPKVEVVVS